MCRRLWTCGGSPGPPLDVFVAPVPLGPLDWSAEESTVFCEELTRRVMKLKPGKAAGPDGILPEAITNGAAGAAAVLAGVHEAVLRDGSPQDWKGGHHVPGA